MAQKIEEGRIFLLSHHERDVGKIVSPQGKEIIVHYENYNDGHLFKRGKNKGKPKFQYNVCPYLFHDRFLHSFCKGISHKKRDRYIWVYKDENGRLLCDLVFKVKEIIDWNSFRYKYKSDKENFHNLQGEIKTMDFSDEIKHRHFHLGIDQHNWNWDKKGGEWVRKGNEARIKTRFSTAFASEDSYQPQDKDGKLINIYDYFEKKGIKTPSVRHKGINIDLSKEPKFNFDEFEKWLKERSKYRITAEDLKGSNISKVDRVTVMNNENIE